jgi:Glycosyltransferase family 87
VRQASNAAGQPAGIRRVEQSPWLVLAAGIAVALAVLGAGLVYLLSHRFNIGIPFDLRIYQAGGLIAGRSKPWYDPRLGSPLYGWPGYHGYRFTYTPFAALVFTLLGHLTVTQLLAGSVAVSVLALAMAVWFTLGAVEVRPPTTRAGITLLATALTLALEPVQRTLSLGQIELVLMALVIWDMCQPDRRWWKGAGVGVAAGLKLVPLIFIPYLVLTRRYRQAAVAGAAFGATVLAGTIVLPGDSRAYWLGGMFADSGRTGFVGFGGNQSLRGIITRLVGSVAGGSAVWLTAAVLTAAIGLVCAAVIDRHGHHLLGVLGCALTGLLASPVSWDHHWVWAVPAVVTLAVYGWRATGVVRWAWIGAAGVILGVFGAWPVSMWDEPLSQTSYQLGLIWAPPDPNPVFSRVGDQPWYPPYHWRGVDLVTGNLYVLTGFGLFILLAAVAAGLAAARRETAGSAEREPARAGADRPGAAAGGERRRLDWSRRGRPAKAGAAHDRQPDRLELHLGEGGQGAAELD